MKKYFLFTLLLFLYEVDANDINFTLLQNQSVSSLNTAYLFAHGLGATQQQSKLFAPDLTHENISIIGYPLALFNFPDAKNDNNEYIRAWVNLGQEQDILRINDAYQTMKESLPQHNFILVGVSRGAVTIINYIAAYNHQDVKALVLESPFDTIRNVVKHILRRFHLGWVPFAKHLGLKISSLQFPALNLKGPFPINCIHSMPTNLPILLIHSKKDRVIPIKSSRALYCALRSSGHEHVYLLELDHGSHGKLLCGPDATLYKNVTHAFYRTYGLPHNPVYAELGYDQFEKCQPSIADVQQRIKHHKRSIPLFEFEESEEYEEIEL